MRVNLFPVLILIPTVFFLIRAEFRNNVRQRYIFKPFATLMVIAIALLALINGLPNAFYLTGILVGLVLSLGGDVSLMFQSNKKAFMVGLVLFLLAHIAYAITFTAMNGFFTNDLYSGGILLLIAVLFYYYLKPNLGNMKIPVIAYIIIISLMVNRAISTLFGSGFSTTQAWLLTCGAVLFFISDIILATNRFGTPFKYHRISLLFYYSGQTLIALSVSKLT